MSIMLDIIGSFIIGGILALMLFNFNTFQNNTRYLSDSELQLQQNAKTLAEIINYDLRKVGYDCDSDSIWVETTSQRLSFYADLDRDGTPDLVTYFLGDSTHAMASPNPRDKTLFRVVNSDTTGGPTLGLIKLNFIYMDELGNPTIVHSDIKYIKSEIWVESLEPVDGQYIFTYWEMTINPRNL
jgi:hypothetical protein